MTRGVAPEIRTGHLPPKRVSALQQLRRVVPAELPGDGECRLRWRRGRVDRTGRLASLILILDQLPRFPVRVQQATSLSRAVDDLNCGEIDLAEPPESAAIDAEVIAHSHVRPAGRGSGGWLGGIKSGTGVLIRYLEGVLLGRRIVEDARGYGIPGFAAKLTWSCSVSIHVPGVEHDCVVTAKSEYPVYLSSQGENLIRTIGGGIGARISGHGPGRGDVPECLGLPRFGDRRVPGLLRVEVDGDSVAY